MGSLDGESQARRTWDFKLLDLVEGFGHLFLARNVDLERREKVLNVLELLHTLGVF